MEMIHCVAVRDTPREGNLFTTPNISYHVGDLPLPLLGLGVDEFRSLSNDIDVILHMGAVRSFWDNYHVLHLSNVDSVKELVKLAAPRHATIHYISTVGVLLRDEDATTDRAGSAAAHVPSGEGSDGYVSSKWAGERTLERSVESLGVPSRIYRFLPASHQDCSQKQELLDDFVRYVDALGMIPDMGVWKGRVVLIPAEQIAYWLGESVIKATAAAGVAPTAQFSHYESLLSFHTDELSKYIKQQRAFLKWLGRCKVLDFNYLIASQQATVSNSKTGKLCKLQVRLSLSLTPLIPHSTTSRQTGSLTLLTLPTPTSYTLQACYHHLFHPTARRQDRPLSTRSGRYADPQTTHAHTPST